MSVSATTLLHEAYLNIAGPGGSALSRSRAVHGVCRAGDAPPDHRSRAEPPGRQARRPVRNHVAPHRHRREPRRKRVREAVADALDNLAETDSSSRRSSTSSSSAAFRSPKSRRCAARPSGRSSVSGKRPASTCRRLSESERSEAVDHSIPIAGETSPYLDEALDIKDEGQREAWLALCARTSRHGGRTPGAARAASRRRARGLSRTSARAAGPGASGGALAGQTTARTR